MCRIRFGGYLTLACFELENRARQPVKRLLRFCLAVVSPGPPQLSRPGRGAPGVQDLPPGQEAKAAGKPQQTPVSVPPPAGEAFQGEEQERLSSVAGLTAGNQSASLGSPSARLFLPCE
jgi:hypothetical protein